MDSIPKHEILKFHDDTLSCLRKQYNYDKPGEMDAAIDLLDDWVKKQTHFLNKEYSRDYLERTIILSKGSIERAKNQMERLSTMKSLMPHAFQKYDVKNHFKEMKKVVIDGLLPKLTPGHYRVYAFQLLRGPNLTSKLFLDYCRNGILTAEYLKGHDYTSGLILILDCRYLSVSEIFTAVNNNLSYINENNTIITKGYALRIKGIHILFQNKSIDIVMDIIRKVLGQKVVNRFYYHKNIETLHEYVPKEILPEEFGGTDGSLKELSDKWTELLSSKENCEYIKNAFKCGTDEEYRDKAKFNEMYMGMAGSFRNLHVD